MDVTFLNDYDEPELPEHEEQEPEDAHKKGKPCLILSRHDLFKTRSVKTHFTMLVSVSHSMSTSPVPVIEYVAPASAVTYTALSSVIEYVASAPVVFYAVIEQSALQRSGHEHEHEHTWKRRKKDPMMRCTFFFPVRLVFFFFQNYQTLE